MFQQQKQQSKGPTIPQPEVEPNQIQKKIESALNKTSYNDLGTEKDIALKLIKAQLGTQYPKSTTEDLHKTVADIDATNPDFLASFEQFQKERTEQTKPVHPHQKEIEGMLLAAKAIKIPADDTTLEQQRTLKGAVTRIYLEIGKMLEAE